MDEERSLHASNAGDAVDEERSLRAGALLRELLFDIFDVWRTSRGPPLKRKDYEHVEAGVTRASSCWFVERSEDGDGDAQARGAVDPGEALLSSRIRVGYGHTPLEPIIRRAFFVCETESEERCELPWY